MVGVFIQKDRELELMAVIRQQGLPKYSLSKEGLLRYNFLVKQVINELLEDDNVYTSITTEQLLLGDYSYGNEGPVPVYVKLLTKMEADLFDIGRMNGSARMHLASEDSIVTAQRYEVALRGMNDGIWDWNILTDDVYYSPRWKSMLGYEDDELENGLETWQRMMHPDDAEQTSLLVADFLAGRTDQLRHTTRFKHKDGGFKTIMCRGSILLDSEGVPVRMIGSHTDITDIIEAKKEIESHKELFELAIGASNDGIWEWNFETNELYFSNRWKEMFGYEPDEIDNTVDAWSELIFEEDKERALKLVEDHRKGLIPEFNMIQRFKHKNGSTVYVLSRAKSYMNELGNVVRMVGAHTDITSTIKAQEAVKRSEEHFRSLFENMQLGVMEVDNNDRIVSVYNAFLEMTGYSKKELIGRVAHEIFTENGHLQTVHDQIELRSTGVSSTYEIEIICKDGTKKWCMISGTPRYNDNCEIVGSVGVHLDISERKQMEADLLAAKQEAELGQRSREKLLANVSHEMRTPLQTIVGFISLMEERDLDELARENLNFAQYSTEILHNIISDLLDLNSIQNKQLKLAQEEFDLRMHLTSIESYYKRIICSVKDLDFSFSIEGDLPSRVIGDPFRLHQVIGNLLSNAEKYTHCGSISVVVKAGITDNRETTLQVMVKDTGIGIDATSKERIFDPFTQLNHNKGTNSLAGIGLGLSIVKEIVTLHGGSIKVDSEKDKGSTFTVQLKYKIADERKDAVNGRSLLPRHRTKSPKILLAEDNTVNRKMTENYFRSIGEDITAVENGAEAVEAFKNGKYDIVLLDINMPVMDGYRAASLIRQHMQLVEFLDGKPKIVALTASVLRMSPDKLNQFGFDDFIQKPIALSQLHYYCRGGAIDNGLDKLVNTVPDAETTIIDNYNEVLSLEWESFVSSAKLPVSIKQKIIHYNKEELPEYLVKLELGVLANDVNEVELLLHYLQSSFSALNMFSIVTNIQNISAMLKEKPNCELTKLKEIAILLNSIEKIITFIYNYDTGTTNIHS